MHLSSLSISNYKCFNATPFSISLNLGLTVLVGENGSGKSAVIDAIRLVLNEDEYGNRGVSGSDFHRPVSSAAKEKGADSLSVVFSFGNLTEDEQIAYLPWLDQRQNEFMK
jgi:predicted ATP-dependent endonuclease of OLD family